MKKILDLRISLLTGGLVLALVLFGSVKFGTAIVSHAESQGRITAASVNIRKEPSTTSDVVASTERDKIVSIVSQEQGADGQIWYKVYVNANTMGYIRSDLLTITDGSTPPTETTNPGTPAATETPPPPEETVQMTEVNPVSATVLGESVKLLGAASAGAQEVAQMQSGTTVTVTGQGTDSAGTIWYQVSFESNGTQMSGFVQSVYVTLSEDLTPVTSEPPENNEPAEPEPTEEPKQYETLYENGKWLVYNIDNPQDGYPIQELIDGNKNNVQMYEESQKTIKNQKLIIIILVFLLVAAVAGIAFLVFKVRDMMDSAYFSEVENETLRKRGTGGSQSSGRVMHSAGADRQGTRVSGSRQPGAGQETRQTGASQTQRPAGAAQGQRAGMAQTQRPAGSSQMQRPVGVSQPQRNTVGGQGQRPAAASQRSAGTAQGQRPEGVPQGQRPAAASQTQRPAGASQGQRQPGAAQGQRPAGIVQGQRPAGVPQGARPVQNGGQKAQAQPRNFMADDEDFEFEFLNYDGDDEK